MPDKTVKKVKNLIIGFASVLIVYAIFVSFLNPTRIEAQSAATATYSETWEAVNVALSEFGGGTGYYYRIYFYPGNPWGYTWQHYVSWGYWAADGYPIGKCGYKKVTYSNIESHKCFADGYGYYGSSYGNGFSPNGFVLSWKVSGTISK
ncbi:MAG: hypothetical protein HQM10_15355 [Candidatus Riflebacteria bacterium]|nr:hypothetical protein [Candidatus Riflebacteria bacterium]